MTALYAKTVNNIYASVKTMSKCDVKDSKGNHCPESPIYLIDDNYLCFQCYCNYIQKADICQCNCGGEDDE